MEHLIQIARGITHTSAAQEFKSDREPVHLVRAYASNVCGVWITHNQAKKIAEVCKAWFDGLESGELSSDDYQKTVIEPLTRND